MASISTYTDGVSGGTVPILGYLTFYTVTGERVPHASAVANLSDGTYKHIGAEFPQKAPKDADVFKRIASNAKRTKVPTDNSDVTRNVLVRNVGTSNNTTTKRIVVEDVGKSKKALAYEQHFDVEFNHTSGLVVKRDLTPILLAEQKVPALSLASQDRHDLAEQVADEIINDYMAWRGCLNSYAIREWLRSELQGVYATSIKRGVYFISADNEPTLDELTRFVNLLPGGSMFHTIPLPDNAKQRKMLEDAYELEAQEEIDNLMSDVVEIVSGGVNFTEKGRQAKIAAAAALNQKMTEYQELLDSKMGLASARLDLLNEIMDEFMEVEPSKRTKKADGDSEPVSEQPEATEQVESEPEGDEIDVMLADLDDLPDDLPDYDDQGDLRSHYDGSRMTDTTNFVIPKTWNPSGFNKLTDPRE